MNNLHISATKYTPEIHFDAETHLLEVRGESYPENTAEFYAPVFAWINELLAEVSLEQRITVNLEIIYFNSSSSKVLMDLFDLLDNKAGHGVPIQINWIYDAENESALEYGEEFQEDLKQVVFHLQKKES